MPEFRLYLRESCLLNPPPAERTRAVVGALLGLLVPKVIEAAIGGIATALKKAGDKETRQVTADEFASLYVADDKQALAVNPDLGCILAVWFNEDGEPPADDEISKKLRAEKALPAGATLAGAFEAAIRPVSDATSFYLETRYFCAREFIGERGKKERDYVITLNLSTPDATIEGQTFALGKIDLGTIKRNGVIAPQAGVGAGSARLRSNLMPWSQISQASKAAYDVDVAAGRAAKRRYMPVTFTLTVSETADGNAFLLKLGDLLGGAAGTIAGAVSKKILPGEVAKAAAEEAASATKLYEEELQAEIEVEKAKKALADGGAEEKPRLQLELELAKRKLAWRTRLREAAGLDPR